MAACKSATPPAEENLPTAEMAATVWGPRARRAVRTRRDKPQPLEVRDRRPLVSPPSAPGRAPRFLEAAFRFTVPLTGARQRAKKTKG
jgi:hypothetical protein